ncbi:hypothetical protein M3936_19765 [Sutcliffiella horikoshii]|uniref:hypothetical protein n=1 Tax=Sutcliffiella horikoshii TaxID=79883 RepID=UPI002040EF25|nr:hypothetical protein [Sutcliffiella horikoshii]MCM3619812.1 hypothetical protein [Sutcliffiella horikoshii]
MSKKVTKTVRLDFKPVQVTLEVNNNIPTEQLLRLAEEAVIQQIKQKRTGYSYSVEEEASLSLNEARPGLLVRRKDTGEIAVIYDIKPRNKYPIGIVMKGIKRLKVMPIALEKVNEEELIEKAVFGRQHILNEDADDWYEGHTGYLKNQKEFIPVVITKRTKSKMDVYPLTIHTDKNVTFYTLKPNNYPLLKDHREE